MSTKYCRDSVRHLAVRAAQVWARLHGSEVEGVPERGAECEGDAAAQQLDTASQPAAVHAHAALLVRGGACGWRAVGDAAAASAAP
jgi:hypothetical protein